MSEEITSIRLEGDTFSRKQVQALVEQLNDIPWRDAAEAFKRNHVMDRAYSTFDIKSVDEDKRIVEGMASTPSVDRMGDIVEPLGCKYALPLPALLFHDAKNPVASIDWIKPGKDGIPFRMSFPKAGLLPKVDEAWTMVKEGLIRAVSIGFKEIESALIKETGGIHFLQWELLEISLVSVPANAQATITNIKSLDQSPPATPGPEPRAVVRVSAMPGASGKSVPLSERKKGSFYLR